MKWLEFSVGAFVIAGFLAIAFLALKVSGLSFDDRQQGYTVYAKFSNISGLSPRAKVSVAGVNVGKVVNITLDDFDYLAVVEMEIDQTVDYLTFDTIASVQTEGVLGEKYVALSIGGDEELIGPGDIIENTQSAVVLEELIGKVLANFASD